MNLRGYDSEIAFTDHHIGLFLDALKRAGLYDDALILFFSDHGEEFLDHGRFGHQKTVYEEVIQVPLIVKLPRQHGGKIIRGTFPLVDVYPSLLAIDSTALDLAGEASPFDSLVRSKDKPLYSSTVNGVQSVRVASRDLTADPLEQSNLLKTTPKDSAALAALLEEHESAQLTNLPNVLHLFRSDRGDDPTVITDKALIERLKSLGYANPGTNR